MMNQMPHTNPVDELLQLHLLDDANSAPEIAEWVFEQEPTAIPSPQSETKMIAQLENKFYPSAGGSSSIWTRLNTWLLIGLITLLGLTAFLFWPKTNTPLLPEMPTNTTTVAAIDDDNPSSKQTHDTMDFVDPIDIETVEQNPVLQFEGQYLDFAEVPMFTAFQAATPPLVDYADLIAHFRPLIKKEMDLGNIEAITIGVVDGSELVWEEGFYANDAVAALGDPDSAHIIPGLGNIFLSHMLLQLQEEGLIDTKKPVQRYLSDFDPPVVTGTMPAIMVNDLMDNSSGLSSMWRHASHNVTLEKEDATSMESRYEQLKEAYRVFPPDNHHNWQNNNNSLVMAQLVAKLRQQPISSYVAQHYFAKFEMDRSEMKQLKYQCIPWRPQESWQHNLSSARVSIANLNHFMQSVLSDASMKDALKSYIESATSTPLRFEAGSRQALGFSVAKTDFGGSLQFDAPRAKWDSTRFVMEWLPEHGLGVVIICKLKAGSAAEIAHPILLKALEIKTGNVPVVSKPKARFQDLPSVPIADIVGTYLSRVSYNSERNTMCKVENRKGQLELIGGSNPPFIMVPEGDGWYRPKRKLGLSNLYYIDNKRKVRYEARRYKFVHLDSKVMLIWQMVDGSTVLAGEKLYTSESEIPDLSPVWKARLESDWKRIDDENEDYYFTFSTVPQFSKKLRPSGKYIYMFGFVPLKAINDNVAAYMGYWGPHGDVFEFKTVNGVEELHYAGFVWRTAEKK
jgi:CubicO group peptidase (beta-lactamase class C family)